jgi:hypothetical protein
MWGIFDIPILVFIIKLFIIGFGVATLIAPRTPLALSGVLSPFFRNLALFNDDVDDLKVIFSFF